MCLGMRASAVLWRAPRGDSPHRARLSTRGGTERKGEGCRGERGGDSHHTLRALSEVESYSLFRV